MAKAIHNGGITSAAFARDTTAYRSALSGATGTLQTIEAREQVAMRSAGTFSDLFVRVNVTVAATTTITFRKNGANGNQTISVGSGLSGAFEDATNTDDVVAGDLVNLAVTVGSGTGGPMTITSSSLLFDADTDTVTKIVSSGSGSFSTASETAFQTLAGSNVWTLTEATVEHTIRDAGTFKNLFVYIDSNARTTTTTFGLRKNQANGNLVVSVLSTLTGVFEDTSNTDSVDTDDEVNFYRTSGLLTGAIVPYLMAVEYVNTEGVGFFQRGLAQTIGASGTTRYWPIGTNADSSIETPVLMTTRMAVDVDNLFVYVTTAHTVGTGSVTLRKNSADSALTVSLPASTTGIFEDLTNIVVFDADDTIDYKAVGGTTGSITFGPVGVMVVATAAEQTVEPAIITNTPTLFAPSITRTLRPALISNPPTIFEPAILQSVALGLIANPATLFDPEIEQTVSVGLIDNAPSIFAPVVVQAQFVELGLISNPPTLYAPQVNIAGQIPTITNGSTLFDVQVTQSVVVGVISNSSSVFSPSIAQSVSTGTIANGHSVFAPSVSQALQLDAIANSSTVFSLTVTQQIAPALITNPSTVFAPQVMVLATQTLLVPLISNLGVIYVPAIRLIYRFREPTGASVTVGASRRGITVGASRRGITLSNDGRTRAEDV